MQEKIATLLQAHGSRRIDVLAPYDTKEEAWTAAVEAFRVFGGGSPLPVAEVGGLPRKRTGVRCSS